MSSGIDASLKGHSVLIVDDHDPTRMLLVNFLGGLGAEVDGASGGNEALEKMRARRFDLVLLDLRMDDMDGLTVLKTAKAENLADNYTMMSAEGTVPSAVEAIRLGASDFLVKPFDLNMLMSVVKRVLRLSANRPDERDPRALWRDRFAPNLIGEHESLLEIFLVLERIANTDCTVLILGESGTGKELIARAVHNASNRTKKDFVPVNCGAIPETLIESELFGHAKGAFSGATTSREGRFAAADNGTLFLDEIGEMSLAVQVKFLRVLQEGEYVPVGETRPRSCDVRIIAATNKDLERMSGDGTFREDLFYRLNLIPIHLPPLRERGSDVPLLANRFLEVFRERRGAKVTGFTPQALSLLERHSWPGNVRELENTIERMTLLHQGSGILDVADLPTKIRQLAGDGPIDVPRSSASDANLALGASGVHPAVPEARVLPDADAERTERAAVVALERQASTPPPSTQVPAVAVEPGTRLAVDGSVTPGDEGAPSASSPEEFVLPEDGIDLRKAVEAFETNLIEQALERTGGNKNQASRLLGMNRTTLVEKLRKRRLARERAEKKRASSGE